MSSLYPPATLVLRSAACRMASAGLLLTLLFQSTPSVALPSVCDAFAAREPLAMPSTEITVDDALDYLEQGHTFSEYTRELLYDELLTPGAYPAYLTTGTLLDLVQLLMVTAKTAEALERGNYLESLCLVSAQGAAYALRHQLAGTALSGVASTATVAAIPIELALESFLNQADSAAWNNQMRMYVAARELGYSHADILGGASNIDLAFDDRGWLLMAGDVCVLWGCGGASLARIPVTGSSPAAVYDIIGTHYEASLAERERAADEAEVIAEIVAAVQPGIQASPRWPDWPEPVDLTATGSAIEGLPDSAYQWDFGDGDSASGPQVQHRYDLPGSYQIQLGITLDDGSVETIQRDLYIAPPEIQASAPDGWEARIRRFSIPSSNLIDEYRWDFGDGTPVVVGADIDTVEHEYASDGERRVTLTLIRDTGDSLAVEWRGFIGTGTRYLSGQTIYGRTVLTEGEYIVKGTIRVASGATLVIEPGAILKFVGGSDALIIEGTLLAEATGEAERIVFTSASAEPQAGDWDSIEFLAGSAGALRYVTIEYAGPCYQATTAALYIESAPTLDHVVVRDVENRCTSNYGGTNHRANGIWIRGGGAPTITNSLIEGVESYGLYTDAGAGAYQFRDGIIRNSGTGVYLRGSSSFVFADNEVTGNTSVGEWSIASPATVVGNSLNGGALRVRGTVGADALWDSNIELDGAVRIPAGVTLTIAPGVSVFGWNSALIVEGTLLAEATGEAERIVFTSASAEPQAGDWDSIEFLASSAGALRYVTIEYAGPCYQATTAALYIESAPTLDHVVVRDVENRCTSNYGGTNHRANGIWIRGGGAPIITDSVIEDVESYGLYAETDSGAYRFEDGAIRDSGTGVYLRGSGSYVFADNELTGNGSVGAWSIASPATVVGNSWAGNGGNDALRVRGTVGADVLWDSSIELDGPVRIPAGVTLTIAPGVSVFGWNSALIVEGTLLAEATGEAERIVFTSASAEPQAGDWDSIEFLAGSAGALRYVTIEYAGPCYQATTAALYIESAPTLDHVVVRDVENRCTSNYGGTNHRANGIWIRGGGAPIITDSVIEDVESYGLYAETDSGAYRFEDGAIRDSGTGVYLRGSGSYVFADNELTGNGSVGAWSIASPATVVGNSWAGNGGNDALRVRGTVGADVLWDSSIELDGPVRIPAGVTLTIAPGVSVFGWNSALIVEGTLLAEATGEAERIFFTSASAEPQAGDWDSIEFLAGSAGALRYVTIEYAGPCYQATTAALYIESAPTLDHVVVRDVENRCTSNYGGTNHRANGIWIRGGGAPIIANFLVEGVEHYGLYSQSTQPLSLFNTTIRNNGNGIYSAGAEIDARWCDWGDPTGPYHPTLNPDGLGNRVSDHVLFEPWGLDFDRDGLADAVDPDDDNDNVPDERDTAPRDADLPSSIIHIQLQPGANLIGYAAGVPPVHRTCVDLLADIGADSAPNLSGLSAADSALERCGDPDGLFDIVAGRGYVVSVETARELILYDDQVCVDLHLEAGVHLLGHPSPAQGLSCFGWLASLGANSASALRRLDSHAQRYETCTFDHQLEPPTPTGMDFPIRAGEGYLLDLRQPTELLLGVCP